MADSSLCIHSLNQGEYKCSNHIKPAKHADIVILLQKLTDLNEYPKDGDFHTLCMSLHCDVHDKDLGEEEGVPHCTREIRLVICRLRRGLQAQQDEKTRLAVEKKADLQRKRQKRLKREADERYKLEKERNIVERRRREVEEDRERRVQQLRKESEERDKCLNQQKEASLCEAEVERQPKKAVSNLEYLRFKALAASNPAAEMGKSKPSRVEDERLTTQAPTPSPRPHVEARARAEQTTSPSPPVSVSVQDQRGVTTTEVRNSDEVENTDPNSISAGCAVL